MVEHMRAWGNTRANGVWNPDEGRNPVPLGGGEEGRQGEMERYIRNKYERGLFRGDRKPEVSREPRTFKNDAATGGRRAEFNGAQRRPSMEEIYDDPRRQTDQYAYGPTGTTKKKIATRAHVDANWADFIGGTTPHEDSTDRPTSSGSRKAGRLLGMNDDRGAVRLPPVTRAPRGLVYKREGEEGRAPPPPVPRKKTPEPEPAARPAPTVAADLVNLNDSIHVPAPYHVSSVHGEPAPPMQRMFHQPQPMASPLPLGYNAYNPFLNPAFQQPLQSPANGTGYPHSMQPPSANGTGYPTTQPQFTPTSAFPFQQHLQQPGFYSPGPASAGGYFANGNTQGMGNPFFAQQQQQQQQQGTGYGGCSR